jgi:cyclopropane fatty-acyl-phospholipid synthase-like methyltransferase
MEGRRGDVNTDQMSDYIHRHTAVEQQRLLTQAELWRDNLILDGTCLPPGARLLDVGCGVGAVLRILGESFPGVRLHGVDIEPAQIDFASKYLADHEMAADLRWEMPGTCRTTANLSTMYG